MKVGTNFEYEGHDFLDRRTLVSSTSELLGWDKLIPEGFEVCLNGTWYTYKTTYWNEETGHFQKRVDNIDGSGIEEQLRQMSAKINELMNNAFPITFTTFTGGGNYEVGSSIAPVITWTIQRKAEEVTPTGVLVNSVLWTGNMNKYVQDNPISSNTNYTITCLYDELSCEKTASYRFYYKKFYGVSPKASLSDSEIQALPGNTWASSVTLSQKFDCSPSGGDDGKYIWYVVPSSLYSNKVTIKIGGFVTSDLEITTRNITNAYGVTIEYTLIRTTKQTGSGVVVDVVLS